MAFRTGSNINRLLEIDKRHTLIEQLTPAIQISILNQPLLTIPFDHVMHFEISYGTAGQQTATLQAFDPTFKVLDVTFFNAAQLTQKGIPTKIRWGYAFVPSTPEFVSDRDSKLMQEQFLSEEYNFYLLRVESEPQRHGNLLTAHFVPIVFNPVMTTIKVDKTFITGDVSKLSRQSFTGSVKNAQNQLSILKQSLEKQGEEGKKQFAAYEKALKQFQKITGQNLTQEQVRQRVQGEIGPQAEVIGEKLSFSRIYFELMKIADANQANSGLLRDQRWQSPLPIFPTSLDDEHDYILFEGRNDNIWECLLRLGAMMVSKTTRGSARPIDFNRGAQGQSKPRWRMVGGKFTPYTARLKASVSKDITLLKDAGKRLDPDQLNADQTTFTMWQFKEAPYDFMIRPADPIASYKYHAGSKSFDKTNLNEVLEFGVDVDKSSAWFVNPDLLSMSQIRNNQTGASTRAGALTNIDPNRTVASQRQAGTSGTQVKNKSGPGSNSIAGTRNQQTTERTDPRQASNTSSTTRTTQTTAPTSGRTSKSYDIPLTVSNVGNAGEIINRFADLLRTKAAASYPFEANMTLVGDPRFDPTFVNTNTTIEFEYVNKNGEINPLYTGRYHIKNIKHVINPGSYRTELELYKVVESIQDQRAIQNNEQELLRPINPGEALKTALIEIIIQQLSGERWKLGNIAAWSDPNNVNRGRVNQLLTSTVRRILEPKIQQKLNTLTGQPKQEIISRLARQFSARTKTQQKLVTGQQGSTEIETNFIIYGVK